MTEIKNTIEELDDTADWSAEPSAALIPGTILGNKYKLLEQIGRGGIGSRLKSQRPSCRPTRRPQIRAKRIETL